MRLILFFGPRIALKARFGPKGGPKKSNGPNIGPVTAKRIPKVTGMPSFDASPLDVPDSL